MMKKITYPRVGDNYATKDPIKKLALAAAKETGKNLLAHGLSPLPSSQGESAFVCQVGKIYLASVVEGLGTKNLVADGTRKISGKTYYDIIGHDTVATIINDLITSGATPITIHAYWAVGDNDWLTDRKRLTDLISGWKSACDLSDVAWGGGETPTLKGIITSGTIELGGAATGIIKQKRHLITADNLQPGDRIILLRSTGINANGLSLARAVAAKLPGGYATKLASGKTFGETLLNKTNIYVRLMGKLRQSGLIPHYVSNITGHGLRKIMRAKKNFSYVLEKIFSPQEVFSFIQPHAGLSDQEMYGTFNMGMDFALFVPEKIAAKVLKVIRRCGFSGIDAGSVQLGPRRLIIKPLNLTFKSETLELS